MQIELLIESWAEVELVFFGASTTGWGRYRLHLPEQKPTISILIGVPLIYRTRVAFHLYQSLTI